MDYTLFNFGASYVQYKQQHPEEAFPQNVPGFFIGLAPITGAIETVLSTYLPQPSNINQTLSNQNFGHN
jgi:hypothetical protein